MHVAQHRSQFPKLIAEFDAGQLSLEQVDAAIAAPAWADAKIVEFVKIATVTKIRRAMRSNQFEHDPDTPVDKHHKLHHQGQLGISGNADQFNTVIFTDARGQPIPGNGTPIIPTHPPPEPTQPYSPPLAGRFDWNWIGLGWTHPNARAKHLQQLEQHLAARARTAA